MSQAVESHTPIPFRREAGTNVVTLAASNPIITHEELAALEFEAEPYFVGFDKDPARMEEHEEKLRSIGIMSRFAVALLGKTKAELIEAVRAMDAGDEEKVRSDNFLRYIVGAREKLEALLGFITALELRHACAMANVYPDDDERLPPIPKPPTAPMGRRRRKPSY
jgi:hypothetical protein